MPLRAQHRSVQSPRREEAQRGRWWWPVVAVMLVIIVINFGMIAALLARAGALDAQLARVLEAAMNVSAGGRVH